MPFFSFQFEKEFEKVLVIEVVQPLNSKGMLLLFKASSSLMLNCPLNSSGLSLQKLYNVLSLCITFFSKVETKLL